MRRREREQPERVQKGRGREGGVKGDEGARRRREREKAHESIVPGELEGVRGKLATSQLSSEPERGACPIFTGPSKSNLPASSSIGTVA